MASTATASAKTATKKANATSASGKANATPATGKTTDKPATAPASGKATTATPAKKKTTTATGKASGKASTSKSAKTATATAPKAPVYKEPVLPDTPMVDTTSADTILKVDPRNVVVQEGFNVRFDMGDINQLARQIKENGQIDPVQAVKLDNGTYELVDGHRRLEAIKVLMSKGEKITTIDVREFTGSAIDRIVTMGLKGTGQKKLTELEEAEIVKRLEAEGLKKTDVEALLGISQAHYYNLKTFLKYTPEIVSLIKQGKTTATTVLHITRREKDPKEQLRIVKQAIKTAERQANTTGSTAKAVTAKDVAVTAKVRLDVMIQEVVSTLDDKKVRNGKVDLLKAILEGKSVEELVAMASKK